LIVLGARRLAFASCHLGLGLELLLQDPFGDGHKLALIVQAVCLEISDGTEMAMQPLDLLKRTR
jgi:hypothetical protein